MNKCVTPSLRSRRLERRQILKGLAFCSPWIIGLLVMYLYPLVSSFIYSFTDFNGLKTVQGWVGLDNFVELFEDWDEDFWIAVQNTLVYTVISVPISLTLGYLLALALSSENIRGKGVFRVIAYIPNLIPVVAVAIVWIWMFNTQFGVVNLVLGWFGVPMIAWLTNPSMSIPSLVIITQWGVGGGLLVYLAGINDIPKELYEAAVVDGAGSFTRFWKITLPLSTPVLYYQLLMGVIGSLQQFALPKILGGRLNSMLFYNIKLYNAAFRDHQMGLANAMGWLMFVFVLLITLLMQYSSRFWVHYMDE